MLLERKKFALLVEKETFAKDYKFWIFCTEIPIIKKAKLFRKNFVAKTLDLRRNEILRHFTRFCEKKFTP